MLKRGIFALLLMTNLAHANTGVGNGGDVFSHYLETTRFALKQALQSLEKTPSDQATLCAGETNLSADQQAECRTFISQTIDEVLALNFKSPPTEFIVADDPLIVTDPDGKPFEVDAMTD